MSDPAPLTELDAPGIDKATQTELEAAAFRRLVSHLRERTDVQNIDMMNLAGFCRNCLSNWYKDAAGEKGVALDKAAAREIVYGMPFDQWREKYQTDATADQKAAFAKSHTHEG
ncbi:MAG: DUF1244 domain-containing protein [Pseudomonadota bacterium]